MGSKGQLQTDGKFKFEDWVPKPIREICEIYLKYQIRSDMKTPPIFQFVTDERARYAWTLIDTKSVDPKILKSLTMSIITIFDIALRSGREEIFEEKIIETIWNGDRKMYKVFKGVRPPLRERPEYLQNVIAATKNLCNVLEAEMSFFHDIAIEDQTISTIRVTLTRLINIAEKIKRKSFKEKREPFSTKNYYMFELSKDIVALFGKPNYEFVAAIGNVMFDASDSSTATAASVKMLVSRSKKVTKKITK